MFDGLSPMPSATCRDIMAEGKGLQELVEMIEDFTKRSKVFVFVGCFAYGLMAYRSSDGAKVPDRAPFIQLYSNAHSLH